MFWFHRSHPTLDDVTTNSVGFPVPGLDCKIVDEEGNTVPRGITGELRKKGPFMFSG